MTETTQPWWLSWITPLLGALGAVVTAVAYVVRKLLVGIVKDELETKHAENVRRFDRLETMLEESRDDRQKIHREIYELKQQESYDRGLAAGRHRRPRED